ncbi:isoprenoid synthase domain-containing protein [Boletus edulis BED1]|uniref:Terpene synthase n=1 Tax=Boletus edulis BED1 TaxID=1328754 RepID=A0AAD4GG43_BOLED|nr:isoprenoid synthase domain-containing protein [Boletus edulis BED1]
MSPTATYENVPRPSPAGFILPDLVSDCHYPLFLSPHCYKVARASEQWLLQGARLVEPRVTKFMGLKAGELTAACYPDADEFHLRVCSDFMNWLFNMDDWLDEFDVTDTWGMRECCIGAFRDPINFQTDKLGGLMSKSFFGRFIQTGGPGCTERFIHTMDLFFIAVAKQADDRAKGRVPDLESYITVRRDTSGCKPCFALIEYAARIDLPDEVMSHPVIMSMEEATNDLVTWSNDIFSYNVEQSRHDTHNMIVVLMREQGLDLQGAVDYVGALCKGTIQRFEDNRAILPLWGEELDKQVAIYVQGLQNWIVGSLHWSFDSERYFGKEGLQVKEDRIIKLLPKRPL